MRSAGGGDHPSEISKIAVNFLKSKESLFSVKHTLCNARGSYKGAAPVHIDMPIRAIVGVRLRVIAAHAYSARWLGRWVASSFSRVGSA